MSSVTSAHDALAVLRSNENISIVLSDLIMEGVDGLTLLSKMKEVNPDIPVVMVTAVHDISVALAAIRNGAYDYLLKPFEREQLLAMVRRALETRRLRLENLAYQTNLESLVSARTEMLRKALSDLERSYDITGGAGRRAGPERRRDRRPFQTRDRLHHRHCTGHGDATGPGTHHCPRRLPA